MFGFGAFVPLRSLLRRPEILAMQGYFRPKGSLGAGKSRNPFDQDSGALSFQDWCHYTLLDVIEFPYLKDPENTATRLKLPEAHTNFTDLNALSM